MGIPSSSQQWFDVAQERAEDARAMLPSREDLNGPVYMAGWAVECALNGTLAEGGTPRPHKGPGSYSHDLRRLWQAAGLTMRDLGDPNGAKSWLLESWGVHLRYATDHVLPVEDSDVVRAAGQIAGYLRTLARRKRGGQ